MKPTTDTTAAETAPALGGVLLLDDDPQRARLVARDIVERELVWLGCATTLDSALKLLRGRRPELVIAAMRLLDGEDGVATATALRKRFASSLIYLSGPDDTSSLDDALRSEPVDFLALPLRRIDLQLGLRLVVHRRQREHRLAARELERAHDVLQEAQRFEALGRVASGVTHDFNNMLTVVSGLGDTLRRAVAQHEELAPLFDDLQEACERAALLSRQLRGLMVGSPVPAQPPELDREVRAICALLQPTLQGRCVLTLDLAAEERCVATELFSLQRLLLSLLSTACDAKITGGNVVVRTRVVEGLSAPTSTVLLEVADPGAEGMGGGTEPCGSVPRFTTERGERGIGPGWSMVQRVITAAGGDIAVQASPGGASVFRVWLPEVVRGR